MIDLADIRKKAQKEKNASSDSSARETVVEDAPPSREPENGSEAGADRTVQGVPSVQQTGQVRSSYDEPQRAVSSFAPSEESDPLERLFADINDPRLATEEIYFKGLNSGLEQSSETRREWLTFSLGREEYALDIEGVVEIIKPRSISPIPRVPDYILGIMSLRGVILPVFDLKQRLKLGQVVEGPENRIVVCQAGDRIAGLLVDNISQVVRLSERNIEPPPSLMPDLDVELVAGVGRYQGHFLILLNLGGILTAEHVVG